jgi:hypothetical protein
LAGSLALVEIRIPVFSTLIPSLMKVFLTQVLLAGSALLGFASHAQQVQPVSKSLLVAPRLPGIGPDGTPMRPSGQKVAAAPNLYRTATITTRLLPGAHQTYGYEVLVNGKPMIAQPSIPGRPGNDGFRTPAEAQRVADLVASKLRDNQLPPAVTAADLQRLHAGQ